MIENKSFRSSQLTPSVGTLAVIVENPANNNEAFLKNKQLEMEQNTADKTAYELELHCKGFGIVKTKNHGEVKARLYKSYVEFVTLLGQLSSNKLGVEISYKYEEDDLLKVLIKNALKKDVSEKDFDYRGCYQGTIESIIALHTTRDLDLTFTSEII